MDDLSLGPGPPRRTGVLRGNPYEPSNVNGEISRIDWLRRLAFGGRRISLGCLAFSLSLYAMFVHAWYPRLSVGRAVQLPDEFGFVPFATACLIAAIIFASAPWHIRDRDAMLKASP